MSLTKGVINRIVSGSKGEQCIVQLRALRKLVPKEGTSEKSRVRFKAEMYDGETTGSAMCIGAAAALVAEGKVVDNSVVKINHYTQQEIASGKAVTIVVNMDVVPATVGGGGGGGGGLGAGAMAGAVAPPAAPPSYAVRRAAPPSRHVTPVASINPYTNRWTIKVRVTSKSDVRTWNNARGSGKLMSCDLLDDKGDEIRATFFKEAVDKFNELLQADRVYYMSGGRAKLAKKQFTSIKHDYELTFDERSVIELADDDSSIKKMQYNFVPINKLSEAEVRSNVDVVGYIKDHGSSESITTKTGKEISRRNLEIMDESGASVGVTLWGDKAEIPDEMFKGSTVALKGASVSDFNGVSLSTFRGTYMDLNPDIERAAQIFAWYNADGKDAVVEKLTTTGGGASKSGIEDRKFFRDIEAEGLGTRGDPSGDMVSIKGNISYIKSDGSGEQSGPWYDACPNLWDGRPCNKKMTVDMSGGHLCERCQKKATPVKRYIVSAVVSDHTGSHWVTLFNDQAAEILGESADNMARYKDGEDPAKYDHIFAAAHFKPFVFRTRIKMEMVSDENRLKTTILRAYKINYAHESKQLLSAIQKFE